MPASIQRAAATDTDRGLSSWSGAVPSGAPATPGRPPC